MPLLQYFGWVGGVLFTALLAVNWCLSAPTAPASHPDIPLDQKINIRIHTDHKWPERVVFDTTRSISSKSAGGLSDLAGTEAPALAQREPLDAFAEMAAGSAEPCFRLPCSGKPSERVIAPTEGMLAPDRARSSEAARGTGLIFPNPPRRQRGRS